VPKKNLRSFEEKHGPLRRRETLKNIILDLEDVSKWMKGQDSGTEQPRRFNIFLNDNKMKLTKLPEGV